ncbi:hypothetical protein [Nonomuraea cavernae]|uniref:WXG100-like domain-containing protein n=1 Tax=Nonomuraea cavernae TaxID=2045107 RepID=UPI0033E65F5D
MAGGNTGVNTTTSGGLPSTGEGGTSSTDIRPAWETESLPDWVNYILIPLLASGQAWPQASESGLWAMAKPHERTTNALVTAFDPTARSVKLVLAGWNSPATPAYLKRVSHLFGEKSGAGALAKESDGYHQQLNAFARETQYSKISINVAFYIAVIAAFIALVSAFFSAGASAWLVGPYAAAARRAVARILEVLAINAGRGFVATTAGRMTALAGLSRLMASPLGHELIEEIGEEVFIDAYSQYKQLQMGTRTEWDWRKTAAAALGAGAGAAVGLKFANRISRLANAIPGIGRLNRLAGDSPGFRNAFLRFPGRAMNTGLNNTIASPVGSVVANGLVYGQVAMPGADAFIGGFMGGVGRTGTISPFNPDVALALANPSAALAQATDTANRSDVSRAVDEAMANRPAPAASSPTSSPSSSSSPAGVTPVAVTPAGSPTSSNPAPTSPTTPNAPAAGTRQGGPQATPTGPQATPSGQPDPASTQQTPPNAQRPPAASHTQPTQNTQPAPAAQPDPTAQPAQNTQANPTTQPTPAAQPDPTAQPAQTTQPAPAAQPDPTAQPAQTAPAAQPDPTAQPDPAAQAAQGQSATGVAPDPAAQPQSAAGTTAPAPDPTAQPTAGNTTTSGNTTTAASPATATNTGAATAANTLSGLMAQAAVSEAQRLAFPHGVPLQDGGIVVTGANGRAVSLSPEALRRTEERLMTRAANGATAERLLAEAAATLGAEIAIAGGRPASEGALDGLNRLADAAPDTAPEAADHSRAWNNGDSEQANRVASRLSARAPGADAALRAGFYDVAAAEIADRLAALSDPQPAAPSPQTGPGTGNPRTVAAQQIKNSLFQPRRRRPAHHGPVTVAEIRAAITSDLDLSDFGGEVLSLTWDTSSSASTMLVRTRTHGTLHYRIRVGDVSGGNVAESDIRTGSATDPIVMKIAPRTPNESLYRAVVHEISHGGQTHSAAVTRSEQGMVRRWVSRTRPVEGRDECVPSRLNEFRFLSRKWRGASSMDEKQRWAHEIDQLLADLRSRGQSPPVPPWLNGSAVAPPPGNTPLADLTAYVRRTIDSLTSTETGMNVRVGAKIATAAAAEQEAEAALENAAKAEAQRDRGASERARKEMANAEKALAKQERHLRIAEAYQQALEYAQQAREAYERLATELEQGARPDTVTTLAEQAKTWLNDFQDALAAALPPLAAHPSFVPAERLPHLNRLTQTLNDLMEERGIDHVFTADTLDRRLRSEFSRVISGDGALISVGRRNPGEVLIQLSVTDLVEVLDSTKVASEIMNGVLPQGGQTIGATANRSRGVNVGDKLSTWFAALPESSVKEVLKHVELSASLNSGFSSSVTGNASDFALDGGVEDNRGESVQFDARAKWSVKVRTSPEKGWSPTVTVDHGTRDDADSLRVYVSHAYMENAPSNPLRLPEDQRAKLFPEHVVLGLTGVLKLADDTVRALGEQHFPPGSVARRQLYTAFTDDFYSRMSQAVNDPRGVQRIIHVDGRPFVQLQIRAIPRLATAKPVGAASRSHWQERLRVGVTSATGNQSSGRSVGGSLSVGVGDVVPELDAVRGDGEYVVASGPNGQVSSGVSASTGLSVNGVTYHPSVQRYTGHTQGVELEFDYEVTARLIGDNTLLPPIKGEGKGLFRFPEPDAYRYGLPVDPKAVSSVAPDGTPVLRDDPDPNPPPGRKGELPYFYGNEPGKLRGAGPALVQGIHEADQLRKDTEKALRTMGVLAPLDADGNPVYSSDPLERLSQMVNEREVAEQLVKHRLQTGYDQATQDGIMIDLVIRHSGRAPHHATLRVTLEQHFTDEHGKPVTTFVGTTDAQAVVNLDIGSDTNVWSHSRGENVAGGVGYGGSHTIPKGDGGVSPNAGVGGGRDGSRSLSYTTGLTINGVTLTESTAPAAIFDIPHTAKVELLHGNGDREVLAAIDGSARILISSDLLPEDDTTALPAPPPSAPGPTADEVMRYATVQHMDTGNLQDVAQALIPRATRPDSPGFHHVAEFLNVRSLLGHPEVFRTFYGTDLVVRPQGAQPVTASIGVQARQGQSTFVGSTHDVGGDINLTLSSMGVTAGRSSGGKVDGSLGLGGQHVDGHSGGGKVGGAHYGGQSRSQYDLSIWGRERLAIEVGKKYVFLAPVEFDVTGSEGDATQVTRTADGTMLYTVPERHALRLYAEGKLDLPVHQVADAVERFLHGTMKLDRNDAVPLVKRYLSDLEQATAPVPLADEHTPAALINALRPLVDGGSTLTKVDDFLARAAELIKIPREVELPSFFMRSMGHTLIEDTRLNQGGTDVELLDAVLDAVGQAAPEVLNDRVVPDSLRKIFAGKRWWGPIDNIFSEDGLRLRYLTPFDQSGQRDEVVVKVRAEFTDEPAVLLGTTNEVGMIIQDYTYEEHGRSETRSASNSVNAGGNFSDDGHGNNAGGNTDRSRSSTGSVAEQETRLQRVAMFNGMDRVRQQVKFVIEVERTPQRARTAGPGTRSLPSVTLPPVELTGHMDRLIPVGLTRPAGSQSAEPARTFDPRQVPPVHSFVANSVKANLYQSILGALKNRKLFGDAVQVLETELRHQLSEMAATALFERMTGERGHPLRLPITGLRDRVVDVWIKAAQSNLQVLARGLNDVEIGQVWRFQRVTGSSAAGGMAFPIAGSTGIDDGSTGLSLGVSAGEQSSASATSAGGNRREMSRFEKDSAVIVQLTTDFDLTFTRQTLTPEGPKREGKPIHLPRGATGEVVAIMSESDYEALVTALESGAPLGPEWQLVPESAPKGKRAQRSPANPPSTVQADPARPWGSLMDARVQAARTGTDVSIDVTGPDGGTHTYHASPEGSLRGEGANHAFAAAFATLSPPLVELADRGGLDLRDLFDNPRTQATFAERVRTELTARGVDVTGVPPTVWPSRQAEGGGAASGGRSVGSTGAGVSAPEVADSAFIADGRAPHLPDATLDELKEAMARDLRISDFGGKVLGYSWSGSTLTVQTQASGTLRFDVGFGEVPAGRVAMTNPETGHVVVSARVANDQLARAILHEISHGGQAMAAVAARSGQGVIRRLISWAGSRSGRDECVSAHFDEFRHLSRRWVSARDASASDPTPERIDETRKWRHELQALDARLRDLGHTPPAFPWTRRGPVTPDFHNGAIGALPTTSAGLGTLADLSGVAAITPTGPPRTATTPAGQPSHFVVTSPTGPPLTLLVTEEALPAGTAEVRASSPGALSVAVSPSDGGAVRLRLAELIAEAVAAQSGMTAGRALVPGPLGAVPTLGLDDASVLVRVRALIEAHAAASPLERAVVEDALRAELRDAGLTPGTEGAAARQVAAGRAGLLLAAHLVAVNEFSGRPADPAVTAAIAAVSRAAALLGATTSTYGSALVDITLPGGTPMPVEVVIGRTSTGNPIELTTDQGTHVLTVDRAWGVPVIERATAVTFAITVATASGVPQGGAVPVPSAPGGTLTMDKVHLAAEFQELVHQVRTARAQQRPGRFATLVEMADALGFGRRSPDRDANRAALPAELAAELTELLDHSIEGESRHAFWRRMREITNSTGWWPPEEFRTGPRKPLVIPTGPLVPTAPREPVQA